MPLPKQIQDQLKDVADLQKQLSGDPDAEGTEIDAEAASAEGDPSEPGADPDAAPSVEASEHGDGRGEDYKHKYNTLQGMYNADMARMQATNTSLNDRISHLEQLLATVAEQPQGQPQAAPKPVPQEAPKLLSQADMDDFGDSIDIMRKVAKEEMHSLASDVAQVRNELSKLRESLDRQVVPQIQQITQKAHASSVDQFWDTLSARVPDWQTINNDPQFLAWLFEVDVLTGRTRQQLLDEAQKALNVGRVVAFFDQFKSSMEARTQTNAQPSRSASELEKQVAPGRSRGTAAPESPNKAKEFTTADIKKFYEDVRKGKFRGREAERSRMERDIFAAQQNGRIVQAT